VYALTSASIDRCGNSLEDHYQNVIELTAKFTNCHNWFTNRDGLPGCGRFLPMHCHPGYNAQVASGWLGNQPSQDRHSDDRGKVGANPALCRNCEELFSGLT
jgi:hypothetical protein